MRLFFDSEFSPLASLYERDISHYDTSLDQSREVNVDTLAQIFIRHQIDRVNFLKLDLEGHELEALKGCIEVIQKHKIDAIQFEFGGCNIDSRTYVRDFWQLLCNQCQYKMYRVLPQQRLLRLHDYSESLERFNWQNLLAVAPNVNPKIPVV